MTVQAIQVREKPAVNGWAHRRPTVAARPWMRDLARLLVAVVLVLAAFLGMAGMGMHYGAVGMPPGGPTPGAAL